jgi:hypothetical protein
VFPINNHLNPNPCHPATHGNPSVDKDVCILYQFIAFDKRQFPFRQKRSEFPALPPTLPDRAQQAHPAERQGPASVMSRDSDFRRHRINGMGREQSRGGAQGQSWSGITYSAEERKGNCRTECRSRVERDNRYEVRFGTSQDCSAVFDKDLLSHSTTDSDS